MTAVDHAPGPPGTSEDRVHQRSVLAQVLSKPEVGALIGAIAVFILFFCAASSFRSLETTGNILYQASTIGIMAVPVALLMIGGEFDLSAGVAVLTSSLIASLFCWDLGINLWVGVVVSLALSLGVGFLNGWLLHRTKLPSFLVTLGTFFILQGVNLAVTRSISGQVVSPDISRIAGYNSAKHMFAQTWKIGSVTLNITVLFWLVLTACGAYLLTRTKIGNWILAAGGDAPAARAVGVPVVGTKIGLFMTVSFCGWLLGMHLLFSFNTLTASLGVGNEFIYIIAAVVGGCLLTGGYGSVIGASIGSLIYGMTYLGITYAGWNPDWLKTFLGVMLVAATLVNTTVQRKASAR
ncbi:ABC transporter permease [Flexivirga oryzae]|uniref:Xylose transport system permease protein XylH n=1 Tax=Flexivirga oryzae TaxID=1794944 RepID=A0A839N5S6_9MICO|nr:ABC transporter permease [Flexivirga oryzae]MBB2890082.1 simple sugar transport system permease protein [Flexivirga oryzae]